MEFDYVEVSGTPYEMGYSFGKQRKEQTKALLAVALEGKDRDRTLAKAMSYVPMYERFFPEMLEEQKGLAEGAGISLAESILMETKWDLDKPTDTECTAYVVTSPVTENGEFLAGMNKDVNELSRENLMVLHMKPDKGPRKIICAYNGSMAGPAMNEYGVCYFGNSIYGGRLFRGVPQPVWQRMVIESRSVDEVIGRYEHLCALGYPGGPGNGCIADGNGKGVCIEVIDGKHEYLFLDEKGYLSHANNLLCCNKEMHAVEEPWQSGNSKGRQGRLEELFHIYQGKVNVELMKKIMSDHVGAPFGICRHNAETIDGKTSLTALSFIAEPKHGRVTICKGNPCENPFHTYQV